MSVFLEENILIPEHKVSSVPIKRISLQKSSSGT